MRHRQLALRWAAGMLVVAGMAAAEGRAQAVETARCEVPIIHAVRGDQAKPQQFDPAITRFKTFFEKEPFTAWREFKLIDRKELQFNGTGESKFMLPNGREATLSFVEHIRGMDASDHRMRLRLQIESKNKDKGHRMLDTTFVLEEGGVVLQGGQHYQGGVLVLAISCKTQE
jgi:hypothetical protein